MIGQAADTFPRPDSNVVAVSLGHLGQRTDWRLLRTVAEQMSELTVLLIGERHDREGAKDADFAAALRPGASAKDEN